jgi:adenylate kinase
MTLMQQANERFRKIVASQLYDTLLVDNHFSVYENKQLVKAIDDKDIGLYDTFILVEVPVDILHERISQDTKERTRESCDREKIVQHSRYERSVAEQVKERSKRELIEIENIDLEKAIGEIQEKI